MTIMQSYKAGEVLTDPAQQPAVELSTNLREVSRTVPGSMLIGTFNKEKALVGAFSGIMNLRMQFGCNFLKH